MKKNVKLLILSLIASLAFTGSMAACSFGGTTDTGSDSGNVSDTGSQDTGSQDTGSSDTGSGETEEVAVTLAAAENVMQFENKQLNVTVTGSEEAIVWTSSNTEVATVDENGVVTALTVGETTITATVGGVSANCVVTVTATNIPHEIAFSMDALEIYEDETKDVSVAVTYKGDAIDGGYTYYWNAIDGDESVVTIATGENGQTATFTAVKAGTVTYEVYAEARGYEAAGEITITVLENEYTIGVNHKDIVPVAGGYAANLTLGDETTDRLTFDDVYLAKNGTPTEEAVNIIWTSDNENVTLAGNALTAVKAGTTVFTGSMTYQGEEIIVTLTVAVSKGEATLEDTKEIEVYGLQTITLPDEIQGELETMIIGDGVVYSKAEEKGSIEGKVVTVDQAGLPAKAEYLGKGITMTIETNLMVYTMSVDVYTMIIETVEELDKWQEVAAETAVRAGLCIEEQKGMTQSGYFVLGANIEYNKVWTPYKAYGDLWALCYNNAAIWTDNTKTQLKEGAFQEDWGTGKRGGFKGIFDGQGYYINGMSTESSKPYNAFIITLGGGTVKNVAFTNMTIGASGNSIVDRGDGVLENVYVEVNKIYSAGLDGSTIAPTWGLIRSGNGPKHTVINSIIDYSDADLTDLKDVYLGCDITSEILQGVYVVGVPASYTGAVWNHEGVDRHTIGVYERTTDMFADEETKNIVGEWSKQMWTIGENYALPNSVVDMMGGDFEIANEETIIPANTSFVVRANRSNAYIKYALKNAVNGVTLNGNVVTIDKNTKANTSFTVVATSIIDGTTVEKTFTTTTAIVELSDTMTLEVVNTETINLPASVEGTVSKITIGSCVVYDNANGIGSINGKSVTVGDMPAKNADLGDGVQMVITTDKAMYHLSVSVYTMIIDNKEEFNNWQAVAADNSVKAGVVIEEQKVAYLTGYFVLGADIEYNDIWQPIAPYAGSANGLYNLCNKENNNVKGWIATYGADKVIAVNGWTDPAKLGFHGTFDGKGHTVNGMQTQGAYSGFNVIQGTNGTIKNIAFTNAKIGAKSGFLFNRGSGTIENVFVQVISMEGTGSGDDSTVVYGLNGYSAKSVKNVVIDASQCDFTGQTVLYMADLYPCSADGVYVIGAEELEESVNKAGQTSVFYYKADNDVAGSFEKLADLLADEKHGANVKAWDGYWSINEKNELCFGGKVVIDTIVRTEIATEYYTDPTNGNKAVIENELFTVGSVWNVSVNNGAVQEVTIETEGEYTIAIDPATVESYLCKVEFVNETAILRYTKVIAVTGISTLEQLAALGVGGKNAEFTANDVTRLYGNANSDVVGNDKKGYYLLLNDIDCSGFIFAAGYNYQQSFFKGVFDGNGKTLSNVTVNEGGIFGGLHGATIKNVKFTNVTYADNLGNYAGNWGNYTSLFGSYANNTVISDITVTVASIHKQVNQNNCYQLNDAFLVANFTTNVIYKNITIDATGMDVGTLFGANCVNPTFENVTIKANSYLTAYYTGKESTGEQDENGKYIENVSVAVRDCPEGVTFVDTDAE